MKIRIATVISRVFEPAILLALSFVACSVNSGLTVLRAILWVIILMGPMVAYRLRAKQTRGLDWDMHERADRTKPFLYLLGYLVFVGIILLLFEPLLLPVFSLFFYWTIGFFIITVMWTKISGHTGGDMLAVMMILHWYGSSYWPLLFMIPLVAWARVVRKDHTVLQVILGMVYSVAVIQFV